MIFRLSKWVVSGTSPALVMALVLSSCTMQRLDPPAPPPLLHAGPPVQVADVDVLEVSPAMERFLERYVMKYENRQTRLYLLGLAVNDPAILDFEYTQTQTLTAAEAFERRAGNCIAFANMYVALARHAGLDAWFQEVAMRPDWSSQDDTLLVAKHINIVVEGPHRGYVIDVTGANIRLDSRRRIIPDHESRALYYNNLGAEALLSGDLPLAHAHLVKAVEIAPDLPDAWTNLGVVYKRNGQVEDAELAYRLAMRIDPREHAALGNLYDLYIENENLAAAAELEAEVERYRRHNPYYLLLLSEEAVLEGRYEEALRLLHRAIEEKDSEHLFHFALARALFLSGDGAGALASLDRARELAPPEDPDQYDRPLAELVEASLRESSERLVQ